MCLSATRLLRKVLAPARPVAARRTLHAAMASAGPQPRGAFIVFEGADRAGKSTQCQMLVDHLTASGVAAELWRFPDRTTAIGKMINAYLTSQADIDDAAVHLLFSANRWEKRCGRRSGGGGRAGAGGAAQPPRLPCTLLTAAFEPACRAATNPHATSCTHPRAQ